MFSVNQVNQLYVVTKKATDMSNFATDPVGTLYGPFTHNDSVYFKYKGAGGLIATDRIKKDKVKWITFSSAETMQKPLRVTTITMNSNVLSGTPVVGQDYVITFKFRGYFGMSDEDVYTKHASARAFSTSASTLLSSLAISLAKNMSREIDKPFKIEVKESTNYHEVTPTWTADSTKTYTEIRLTEIVQPWELGRYKFTRPDYKVQFVPVVSSGIEYLEWGTATDSESGTTIGNGMITADLEWFCMGERGDQYRGKDWPLSITTPASLLVDATKEYDYLIIHFWDDIDNEGPQKSERDMTFVVDNSLATPVDLYDIGAEIAETSGAETVTADGTSTSATKVAAPVITLDKTTDKATITCATPGASVRYNVDTSPSDPTSASGTSYTFGTEVSVADDKTIKAIAYKTGMESSAVVSATNCAPRVRHNS